MFCTTLFTDRQTDKYQEYVADYITSAFDRGTQSVKLSLRGAKTRVVSESGEDAECS